MIDLRHIVEFGNIFMQRLQVSDCFDQSAKIIKMLNNRCLPKRVPFKTNYLTETWITNNGPASVLERTALRAGKGSTRQNVKKCAKD